MASRFATLSVTLPALGAGLARVSEALEAVADKERDQLPLWLPVGMIVGISAWFHIGGAAGWTAFLFIVGAAALGLVAGAGRTRWGRALAIFAVAALLGCGNIWWKAERVAAPRLDRPQLATFEAEIERFSLESLAQRQKEALVASGLPSPV